MQGFAYRRPLLVLVLLACSFAKASAADIRWDEWGVPHITATDASDALFGFGWAQMRAHANLELRLVAKTRGITARLLGAGSRDAAVNSDIWVREMGIPALASNWLAAQTPDERTILESFAAGLNAYAAAHPQEIDPALKPVLPITPADVLARLIDLTLYTFAIDPQDLRLVTDGWQRGMAAAPARRSDAAGSNGWAIGRRRADHAASLLLINPHLPWTEQARLVEAEIHYGDVSVYGATFIGFPFIALGFNRDLGWTHTVNPMHTFYMYVLHASGSGYSWNGAARNFETREEHIQVKRAGLPAMQEKTLQVRVAVQGPVVAERGDQLLALWVPGRDAPHVTGQYWAMARAHNLTQFRQALGQEQAALFSTVYADHEGHIYYNFGGRNPVGPAGPDRARMILDGAGDRTLWTGIIPLDRLPNLSDPQAGWIQNANDPPWTATWPSPLHEADFPAGLVNRYGDFTNLRAQEVIRLLSGKRRLSLEDLIALKHQTHVELADRVLDDLVRAGRSSSDADVRAASEVLAKWDRKVDADSRGASLFITWAQLMPADGSGFLHPFDAANPLSTPQGLLDAALAEQRLGTAARRVKESEGALDAPWGQYHRLRWGESGVPANGAPDPLGMPRSTSYEADPAHKGFTANGGDSFVAAVAFGPDGVVAQGLLSYGNFTQKPLAGMKDQLSLYGGKQLRAIAVNSGSRTNWLLTESPRR
jgi:acyl-homoserine-lactone acylase